jgi:AmmeMemoRadiSam system protein B
LKPSVRPAAVAGLFYEADPDRLRREVRRLLDDQASPAAKSVERWRALLLPHAGHMYSGRIAAKGVAAVDWPSRVILLGPNHRGAGAAAALSPAPAWRTPLGDVPADRPLAEALLAACPDIEEDPAAHAKEHALEVLLPFLQAARPGLSVVCLSLGEPDLALCLSVGHAVARVVRGAEARGEGRVALVVSSDLSHYLSREENRRKDDRALDALLSGDPKELFSRVLLREHISMCGILPATALLAALESLPGYTPALLAHGDSADAGGDEDRVVGYASVLWSREGAA